MANVNLPVASLPMYDWPEVQGATDRLWRAIRDQLRAEGIEAPDRLTRPADPATTWRDPDLLLGQTCGLPLVTTLPALTVVGAFDHRLSGTPPGSYHSVIIVHRTDPAARIGELAGASVAVNGADSQSGHAVWRHLLRESDGVDSLGRVLHSGTHRASIQAVAGGGARTAAVDAVSWELARRHEPAADRCRVLHRTAPTAGLPIVTARSSARGPLRAALDTVVRHLPEVDRAALRVHGFVPLDRSAYDEIERRWTAAGTADVPRLLIDRGV